MLLLERGGRRRHNRGRGRPHSAGAGSFVHCVVTATNQERCSKESRVGVRHAASVGTGQPGRVSPARPARRAAPLPRCRCHCLRCRRRRLPRPSWCACLAAASPARTGTKIAGIDPRCRCCGAATAAAAAAGAPPLPPPPHLLLQALCPPLGGALLVLPKQLLLLLLRGSWQLATSGGRDGESTRGQPAAQARQTTVAACPAVPPLCRQARRAPAAPQTRCELSGP